MLKHPSAVVVAIIFEGCATIPSGPYGVSVDARNQPVTAKAAAAAGPPLKISAGEVGELASPYFGVVEVTFENQSPVWVQVDQIGLDFGTPDKNRSVLIPWGADIDSWERATTQRNAIRAANQQTALAILALGGGLARAASHRGGVAHGLGGLAAVGALAALQASELETAAEEAQTVERFPGTHLLAAPFRIPPGLFAKRWVLFYTADRPLGGCIDSMILDYETSDQGHGRVRLTFKATSSEWQGQVCGYAAYGVAAAGLQ